MYNVIECETLFDLIESVNKLIENGWEVTGSVSYDTSTDRYLQAIVLKPIWKR